MARRGHRPKEEAQDLNLAPIMNMVMILIPLLLLSTVFMKAGVINISSPRNAQSTVPEDEEREEQTPVPRVVVYISSDGFRVGNQNPEVTGFEQFQAPIAGCPGAAAEGAVTNPHDMANVPPTICLRTDPGAPESAPLLGRLNYAALYNRLVEIRLQPQWFDAFGEENNSVISILGDPEIPFEVLVKTMDTSRFILNPTGGELPVPTGSSSLSQYQLGGGSAPTPAQLEDAAYLRSEGSFVDLFPDPVLLLPQTSGS